MGVAVGFDLGLGVGVGLSLAVGVSVVTDTSGVGVSKIILMALLSGIGEITFLPEIKAPINMITRTKNPIMILTAASVFCRSSIL